MEPQLAPIRDRIVGALYYPGDECGDAYAFCRALIQVFLNAGGKLRTGRRVLEIITRGNVLSGLQTDQGFIACRQAVIAAGNGSGQLLGRVNVSLPIRPAKGYSLTVETPGDPADRPRIGVVDDAMHAAVVALGSRLRIVGTAEFAGNDRTLRAERVENLMQLFAALYPRLAAEIDPRSVRPWAGLRPISADGVPFIGLTPLSGLYVNAGHGHLGWTLAAGSARLLADLMLGAKPEIDPQPYSIAR